MVVDPCAEALTGVLVVGLDQSLQLGGTAPVADLLEMCVLSAALALDAAVVTAGLGASGAPRRLLARATVLFGVFQAAMAGLGAVGGTWLEVWAATWAHWIAFVLLGIVGGRMLVDGSNQERMGPDRSWAALLALAVATSIDALAAGVGLPLMRVPLIVSVPLIGVVTVALCTVAGAMGTRVDGRLGHRAEQLVGAVLIAFGVRIVLAHL